MKNLQERQEFLLVVLDRSPSDDPFPLGEELIGVDEDLESLRAQVRSVHAGCPRIVLHLANSCQHDGGRHVVQSPPGVTLCCLNVARWDIVHSAGWKMERHGSLKIEQNEKLDDGTR